MGNLVTGKVRFSYANVFEPRRTPNGEEKYSIMLLIPKSDTDTYQRIMTEINKTLQENLADTFKGVMPTNLKTPIHDGDGVRQSGEPYGAECKGCWVITANSNNEPEVVDANCNPIISKNEFYRNRLWIRKCPKTRRRTTSRRKNNSFRRLWSAYSTNSSTTSYSSSLSTTSSTTNRPNYRNANSTNCK